MTKTFSVVLTGDAVCAAVYAGRNSDDPIEVETLTKAIKQQAGHLDRGHLLYLSRVITGHVTARHGFVNRTSDQAWLEALEAVQAALSATSDAA